MPPGGSLGMQIVNTCRECSKTDHQQGAPPVKVEDFTLSPFTENFIVFQLDRSRGRKNLLLLTGLSSVETGESSSGEQTARIRTASENSQVPAEDAIWGSPSPTPGAE